MTIRGEIAVQELSVGDLVVTLSGHGNVLKPIVWIGRSPFDVRRHPRRRHRP
jgi:hypothetical protein